MTNEMTNEEAIAIIRKEYLCVDRDCDIERSCGKCDLAMPSKEPILEAYNMAIKALEQKSCEDWHDVSSDEMTLEQARQAVKDLRKKLAEYLEQEPKTDTWSIQEVVNTLEKHGRIREQEPCEDSNANQHNSNALNALEGDAISRQAVLDMMQMRISGKELYKAVYELPPVNPQEPRYYPSCEDCHKKMDEIRKAYDKIQSEEPKTGYCKDCKWWKDSDGAFRRGIGAESQCPMNRIEVFEGNGYCFQYEPQKRSE